MNLPPIPEWATPERRARLLAALRRQSRRFLLVVLVVIGALCGLTALAFHRALAAGEHLLAGMALGLEGGPLRLLSVLLLPAIVCGLLGLLVPRFSPTAGGGLALVRTAYARDTSLLNLRAWLGTFAATPLSLGAGVPLGPEGPTVLLTSGLAAGVGRALGLPTRVVRGMIPVGAAAGIAAIFNTPITGVVFALEEVIGTASRGVLGGAIVAAVAAAVVHKQALGGAHLLPASPAAWTHASELIGFALLGLLAGLVTGVLPRVVPRVREAMIEATEGWGAHSTAVRGALAGLLVGCLGLLAPRSLGIGYDSISLWLDGGGDAGTAAAAFVAKFAGVVIALSAPLVGGVFAPSLFLGASLGAVVGHLLDWLLPGAGIDPGAYALVGMGAFFAGFLRTPIASVLIVFELTGGYDLVAPLMLAVALSSLLAHRFAPETLVERQLEETGVIVEETSDPLSQRRARDAMITEVYALLDTQTASRAREEAPEHHVYPVVDAAGLCVGVLTRDRLLAAADLAPEESIGDHVDRTAVMATQDELLDRLSLRLGGAGETRCPVVESREHPRLVGFLAPSDMLRARVRASAEAGGPDFTPF